MAWGAVSTSDTLNLSSSYQDVLLSATVMRIDLNPGEVAHVQVRYNPQDASPTENCRLKVLATPDEGSTYDTSTYDIVELGFANDPENLSFIVRNIRSFKMQAALFDTDGTAGGDDTASVVVAVTKNGVSL